MGMWIGIGRKARRCYGFDEVSLVPGRVSINPNDVDTSWQLGNLKFKVPILAAAMDGVVDSKFAVAFGKLGGLAVLNLEGIQTRYEHPEEIIARIIKAPPEESTRVIQSMYQEPIKENLSEQRISEIKKENVICAVSSIPQRAERFSEIAEKSGADVFVVQATVTTSRHISSEYKSMDLSKICRAMKIPVVVGNCVGYEVALELMETGISGLLVGIGPGAACTTREVLGIGVPQVTTTSDTATARDFYYKKSGRYVPIITDGGMTTSGDICKAFACGADSVMVGSAFSRAKEAPGKGFHWGMATSNINLPRGTRIEAGITGTLKEILFGPSKLDDGSQNLMGALRTSMGSLGVKNIREMQLVEVIIAPTIKTEGKLFQQLRKKRI